ncbi:MAG: hypothetical protein QME60_08730 [Verrucomicrobiota bacterium]|nr:hypothetical protein [Verrucomicrobiota bacterium]
MKGNRREKIEEHDDTADIAPIVRTRYRFKMGALCPFCGRLPADAAVNVDLNPPFRDMIAVFDRSVHALPCCSACGARYLRRNSRDVALPPILGYPSSILHRLSYGDRVRRWLADNAEVANSLDTIPPGARREMLRRARSVMGYSALTAGGVAALTALSHWWSASQDGLYIICWGAIVAGAARFIVGLARWLKWTLAL